MSKELKHKINQPTDCISEKMLFDYIDKKLSPKEQHLVEKHMLDCELCSDAYDGLLLVKNRNRISSINSEIDKKLTTSDKKETKIIFFNFKTISSIAASIILLVAAVFLFKLYNSQKITESDMALLKKENSEELKSAPTEEPEIDAIKAEEKPTSNSPIIQNELQQEISTIREDEVQAQGSTATSGKEKNENTLGAIQEKPITMADDEKLLAKESRDESKKSEAPASVSTTTATNQPYNYKTSKDEDKKENDVKEQQTIAQYGVTGAKNNDKTIVAKEEEKSKTKTRALKADKKSAEAETAAPMPNKEVANNVNTTSDNFSLIDADNESGGAIASSNAEFPGGNDSLIKFIAKNFNYPAKTENESISSTKIYVQFTVEKDGKISNAKVIKGINKTYDTEALRVVNAMPKWIPAKQNNQAVDSVYTLPIQLEIK